LGIALDFSKYIRKRCEKFLAKLLIFNEWFYIIYISKNYVLLLGLGISPYNPR